MAPPRLGDDGLAHRPCLQSGARAPVRALGDQYRLLRRADQPVAALEAIQGPQDDAEAMRRSFLERRDLIVGLLNRVPGVTCRMPGGAFYAWPNVTKRAE